MKQPEGGRERREVAKKKTKEAEEYKEGEKRKQEGAAMGERKGGNDSQRGG